MTKRHKLRFISQKKVVIGKSHICSDYIIITKVGIIGNRNTCSDYNIDKSRHHGSVVMLRQVIIT